MNTLIYGDNLQVLRQYIDDESVDLIYLDPPFNSKADYNILYKTQDGEESQSQITAFEDTWHWTEETERTFSEIIEIAPPAVVDMITAFKKFIHENDVMAYLTMMTVRLLELRRVLKETGSIYLHCDPTTSHYLKIVMDTIFSSKNFINEIAWCYDTGGRSKSFFPRKHDIIFWYSKSSNYFFNYDDVSLERDFSTMHEPILVDEEGRTYQRNIKYGKEYRYYLEKGVLPNDWWSDIQALNPAAKERLGYPTQKPESLLIRIIKASSKKGDTVLDPFCGCGTTISVAHKLKRKWIGIDITHLAINLIKKRLKESYNITAGNDFTVIGEPTSLDGARELAEQNKYQFQWWITGYIGARPYKGKKRGADSGIDAIDFFYYKNPKTGNTETEKIIISVKGGHVTVSQIRDLIGVIVREKAAMGFFITLESIKKTMEEEAVKAGFYTFPLTKKNYRKIQILTVEQIMQGKKFDIPGERVEHTKKAEYLDGHQNGLF